MTAAMALNWKINDDKRLIEVDADDDVTRAEVERLLQDIGRVEVAGYRKLFDARQADTKMDAEDLLAVGGMFRDQHRQGGPLGPVAIITQDEKFERFSRLLGIRASGNRPLLVFRQAGRARRWLMNQPAAEFSPDAAIDEVGN